MRLILVVILTVTVLLTHPIAFIFLAAGVLSLSITNLSLLRQEYGLLASLFFLVTVLSVLWPYYLVIPFFGSESKTYHPSNRVMYSAFIG